MNDLGLVLSGGGGKGAYEVGAWSALDEYGITPNITGISGTSVGALNAVLFAQGDCARAKEVWSSISPQAVIPLKSLFTYERFTAAASKHLEGGCFCEFAQSIHRWIAKRCADQGIFSKKGLSALIDEFIDFQQVLSFPGPVYAASYNYNRSALVYFNLKDAASQDAVKQRLLASASIPIAFGRTYIDGDLYWDGGLPLLGDNTPVQPLYNEGYRNLIVIHLTREEPVDRSRFPGCRIIEIIPREDLGGLFSGTMNFDASAAGENILRGYQDTVRILEPLFKIGGAKVRFQAAFQRISDEQYAFAAQYGKLSLQSAQLSKEISLLEKSLQRRALSDANATSIL